VPLTGWRDVHGVSEEHERPVDAMARAVEACRQALVDYQTGLLDEEQLRHALFRDGIVIGAGEAWLLDVASGRWSRYEGIDAEPLPRDDAEREPGGGAFDTATLRRWQENLRELLHANGSE
jgi:hypothetical protein